MIRKAQAVWRGTARDGRGELTTQSGLLKNSPYSYRSRFESQPGTNPEELIAAAHAGCFAMAVAFQLQAAGYSPTELDVGAAVTIETTNDGYRITRSALTLKAEVPGLGSETFQQLAEGAKKGCPVSRLMNAEITLDATLA